MITPSLVPTTGGAIAQGQHSRAVIITRLYLASFDIPKNKKVKYIISSKYGCHLKLVEILYVRVNARIVQARPFAQNELDVHRLIAFIIAHHHILSKIVKISKTACCP